MSPLYLYAVLGAPPAGPLGAGAAGEPLRLIECDGLFAAAGEVRAAPPLAPDALRGHDAVVRRLADVADALLPARFGSLATDAGQLCEQLARGRDAFREALTRVAGREQMNLRLFFVAGDAPPPERVPAGPESAGSMSGTAYLAERARAQRAAAEVQELAPLRPVLDRFVAGERIERHDAPPLVASVYHLVARGEGAAYTAAVTDAARALSGIRVTISGPWAPYAFAPEALA